MANSNPKRAELSLAPSGRFGVTEAPKSGTLRREIARHLPALRARALGLCRDKNLAEDLVQDAVVRALVFENTFQVGSNLRAWMHQILLSVFINHCRRQRREHAAFERLGVEPLRSSQGDDTDALQTLSPPVEAALLALPEKFSEVIHLVDLAEWPYRETAEAVGVPVGTVMSRLFRGRRMLAEALREPERLSA